MTKSFNKRLNRAIAVVMAVAMLVGTLPAELLGGIASVKAATVTKSIDFSKVTGDTGTDQLFAAGEKKNESLVIGGYNSGDSKVKFISAADIANYDFVIFKAAKTNAYIESKSNRFNTQGTMDYQKASVQIAPDTDVTVTVKWAAGGDGKRFLNVKPVDGSKLGSAVDASKIYDAKGEETTLPEETSKNVEYTSVYNLDAGTYQIGSSNSTLFIYSIEMSYEGSAGTTAGDDDMVAFERTYNLADGSIVPTTTDGKSAVESDDKLFKLEPGNSNAYGWNNGHGTILKSGNVVTLLAGENSKITKVAIALCTYSKGSVTVTADGTQVGEAVSLTSTACYKDNSANVKEIAFADGAEKVELAFDSTDGVNYCYAIIVSGMEPKPVISQIKATIDVSDPDALLTNSDKITMVPAGSTDGVDVTKGGDYTLKANTSYKVETNNEDIAATVDDKTSVKTGVEDAAYTIAVTNTTVMVKPVITGDDFSSNSYKLVGKTDKAVYEFISGKEIKLPKNTKVSLEVQDAEGKVVSTWLAKVGDAATFTTPSKTLNGAEEVNIVITEVKDVQVTPTITGTGLLGNNTIYLVNGSDKIAVENGKAMTLKPNTEYTVSLDAKGIEATIDAKTTYTTGVKDAEITIAVSTPATKTTEWMFYDRNGTGKGIAKDNSGTKGVVGEILKGTDIEGTSGILYKYAGTSSGVSYDSQLRFRPGAILYLPVQNDTTKITYIQGSNSLKTDRLTYVGLKDSGYSVEMPSGTSMVTIDDVTDLLVTVGEQKYLPIESGGDVKLDMITLVEYNPVNEVTVSGTLEGAAEAGVTSISFKNLDNENAAIVTAEVNAQGAYTAKLKRVAGMTHYAASVSTAGCKIQDANDADKFTLIGNDATATANFSIVKAVLTEISGTVTGVDDSTLKGELVVNLVPDNKALQTIQLQTTRSGKGVYTFEPVQIEVGRKYEVELVNADDLEVLKDVQVAEGDSTVLEIKVTAKPVYEVTGSFVTSDDKASDVTKIVFTNMETPKYSYTFDVTGKSYKATLRAGSYETSVVSDKYEAYDHVDVVDANVSNNVYLQGEADTSAVAYKATVEVGEKKQFTTIADAVDYISRMNRTATQRVTIELEENAVYREQLVIDTPNITIKGNGATITWYYGVGFEYYSAKLSADGKSAYYDEAYAVDRYYKQQISQNPGHWGATVNLLSGATGFKAENLTFENSLNRYLTEEELLDGADANADAGVLARTTANLDVRAYKAKERACVLYIQADNTEYKNCKLLSRQDTLYTGDKTENTYFKDCFIEGTVDYICGDGKAVFDTCTLSMYGYSDQAYEGCYIVANKANANPYGYLFDNCKIVNSTDTGLLTTSKNILARAWGAGTVYWMNTEVESVDMIAAVAYKDMNSKAYEANYNEYNTHLKDNTVLDASRTTTDASGNKLVNMLTAEQAAAVKMTDWFGDWVPSYYAGDFKVTISDLSLDMTIPAALGAASTEVTCAQPGVVLGAMNWYTGADKFTEETFGGETVYTAKLTATLEENYVFADKVTATVKGAEKATVEVKEGVATITVTFPKTAKEGYYVLDLSNGLTKGVSYDGGISVMENMAAKATDSPVELPSGTYTVQVQGSTNPSPNKGEVPTSGAVLVVNAIKKGTINVAIKSTGGKAVHFVCESTGEDYFESGEAPSVNKEYKLPVEKGETYYFYGDGTKLVYFSIIADYRVVERAAWDTVAVPEIIAVATEENPYKGTADGEDGSTDGADDIKPASGEVIVRVKGWVDDVDGADSVAVDMVDAKGNVVQTATSTAKNDKANPITDLKFKPTASGEYTFVPRLVREEEQDKVGKASKVINFVLPMGHATIVSITNKFNGSTTDGEDVTGTLEIVWNKVTEAKSYEVIVAQGEKELAKKTVTGTSVTVDKLPIDATVTVSVAAVGKDKTNKSEPSYKTGDMMDAKVEKRFDRTWAFTAYGSSTSLDSNLQDDKFEKNGYKKNADGSVTVYSLGGSGKVVPGSTDGLAFYYTAMDPATENFTLTADVHVDKWTLSNGQDGFGLMVSDTIGVNGDGTALWNNSYQLFATKIEYNWDTKANAVTTATAGENGVVKYSMKLGLGWIAKEGTTLTDVAKITSGEQSTPTNFSTSSGTLETSAATMGWDKGTYNIVGNFVDKNNNPVDSNTEPNKNAIAQITDFKLQIQRNNTGYILRYLDTEGKVLAEKIFYDDEANKLTQIDKKNIYVGFVASRNAQITVSNIKLTTINPADDAEAMDKEVTKVDPNYQVLSSKTSNSARYELVYYGNVDGKLTVVDEFDNVVANGVAVSAKTKYSFRTNLNLGSNKFKLVIVPDKDYVPGENQIMSNYDKYTFSHSVTYQEFENDVIYVAPAGKATNKGTEESPVDIYTAVAYAKAGQKIYMLGGTYKLSAPVVIDRGHDGTQKHPIYLMADPDEAIRPVLNFSNQTEATSAFTVAGNYWYLKGFDVTESLDAQKGILVAGNNNVLDDIDAYKNGNTGIQLSRYLGTDSRDLWPQNNTILNCTSYLNADAGYEDADGFAAKLTIGDGNKFVGCVAAYNADDGWDLFAKVQTGSIGSVTIENCLAFKNGYVIDADGNEVDAGNGNGFKMGGDSMSGYHVIKNSVAFANKAKGIDSNSCPDIQVYNCTSFNNESYNVAMYTNTAVKTDYYATGILSIKDSTLTGAKKCGEQIKPVGSQNLAKIYSDTNYYFNGKKSVNNSGAEASLDWFKSVDVNAAISGAKAITRDADGSLNMNGFLELTDKAPANVGAVISNTSAAIVLEKAAEVSVYAGTVKTLAEVSLPEKLVKEGYAWAYKETETAVFSGTSAEFVISAEGKEDKAVVVNFVEVTGVELTADNESLVGNDTLVLTATPVVAPAVDLKDVQGASFTYNFSGDKLGLSIAKMENKEGVEGLAAVTRTASSKEGIAKVTVSMVATVAGKKVTKKADYSFMTRKGNADITYTIDGADVVDGVVTVDVNDTFTLKDVKAVGSIDGEDVKVSVNDSKVVKQDTKTNKFTAMNEGTATITMTAKADKNVTKDLIVVVRGNEFKTNVSTITVDKAKTNGAQITALGCYGATVDEGSVKVKSVMKGKTDVTKFFDVENVIGNIYNIITTDDVKGLANGTYTMVLTGKAAGTAKDFEEITVKVMETKPTVTLKQTKKVNLFYTAGSVSNNGTLTASSKQAKITLTQTNANESAYKLKAAKNGYSIVLKKAEVDNAKKNNKIKVLVSYNGYKDSYSVEKTITVGTQNVAPKLVLEVDNKVLYTQLGIEDTALRILDKTTNTYVSGADVKLADSKTSYVKANKNFELLEENGEYTLTASKSGSAKISIQDADWTREIVMSQGLTINNKLPKATFKAVKLNSAPEYAGMEMASSEVTIANALDYSVKDIQLTGKNAKAKELLEYLDYAMEITDEGKNVLNISLNKELPVNKNGKCAFSGTYTFDATFGLNKLTGQKATVKLSLVTNATVTTKQSGSIDLVNRAGSSVTVKPTLNKLNGKVVGVKLNEHASNQFEVEWNSTKGAAVVTVKEDIDMKKGGKYKVTPTFIIETNGGDVEVTAKTITIVPKQSTVKTTKLDTLEVRLSAPRTAATATFAATSPAKAEILALTQLNETKNFKVTYDELSNTVSVSIANRAGLKVGKTYKIKVAMEIEGAGVNTKQQTVVIPVKVLK